MVPAQAGGRLPTTSFPGEREELELHQLI